MFFSSFFLDGYLNLKFWKLKQTHYIFYNINLHTFNAVTEIFQFPSTGCEERRNSFLITPRLKKHILIFSSQKMDARKEDSQCLCKDITTVHWHYDLCIKQKIVRCESNFCKPDWPETSTQWTILLPTGSCQQEVQLTWLVNFITEKTW